MHRDALTDSVWVTISTMETLIQQKMYWQGLKDGVNLAKLWEENSLKFEE